MKFYSRKKPYKYSARLVFFWKYRAQDGRWHQRQVYWGNRETDAIVSRYGCIKSIAQLSDGLERRDLMRRTPWLNRGKEDYSDEHFSRSIYLRLLELKKQTPELPKPEFYRRTYRRRKKIADKDDGQLAKTPGMNLTPEQREKIRKIVKQMAAWRQSVGESFGKADERFDAAEERNDKRVIKRANQIREFGEKLASLTGKTRFEKRHFEKYQAAFPAGTTINFCRLAIRTWCSLPDPIDNYYLAGKITQQEDDLKQKEILAKSAIRRRAEEKKLRQQALVTAMASSKKRPNMVSTNSAAAKIHKSQFYWEFFK